VRGALVEVVEAYFAAGDDKRVAEELVELDQRAVVGLGGGMRIDSGARAEARHAGLAIELAAEIAGVVHLRGALADADGEHRADTGIMRAAQHRFAIIVIAVTIQMGMGIDQQKRTPNVQKLRKVPRSQGTIRGSRTSTG